jgi:hypothetical protein
MQEDADDDGSGSEVEEKSQKKALKVPGREPSRPKPKPKAAGAYCRGKAACMSLLANRRQ